MNKFLRTYVVLIAFLRFQNALALNCYYCLSEYDDCERPFLKQNCEESDLCSLTDVYQQERAFYPQIEKTYGAYVNRKADEVQSEPWKAETVETNKIQLLYYNILDKVPFCQESAPTVCVRRPYKYASRTPSTHGLQLACGKKGQCDIQFNNTDGKCEECSEDSCNHMKNVSAKVFFDYVIMLLGIVHVFYFF